MSESSSSENSSDDELIQEICEDLSKLKPYDFEPLASSGDNSNEESDEQEKQNEGDSRKGSKSWCLCECCEIMHNERECWCCQEANEVTDELFEGI